MTSSTVYRHSHGGTGPGSAHHAFLRLLCCVFWSFQPHLPNISDTFRSSVSGVNGFLIKPNATTAGNNAELGLLGTANLWIGKSGAGSSSVYVLESGVAGAGTGQQATSTSIASGTTVQLVLRADFASGNDTFKLYVN